MSAAARPRVAPLVSGRYVACLAILGAAAASMQIIADSFEYYFQKQPLPLRKPLYLFDVSRLGTGYESNAQQPPPLSDELEHNLGAVDYWQHNLVDRRPDAREARMVRLFVTYYTGKPDMVPHNPRECNAASGFRLVGESNISLPVSYKGETVEIPVSVLEFEPPRPAGVTGALPPMTVLYFFYANGQYVTTREGVKLAVHRLRDRYAFYSKIEVSFVTESGTWASKEASVAAGRAFLTKLMPVLWDDHYQDWSAIEAGAAPVEPLRKPGE